MSVEAKNPILPGFFPDPSMCAVGDDYYLVNSSFVYFPALPIMHSKDLAHWELIGNALDRNSQAQFFNDEVSRGMFAPTIRYNNGKFYIICTNVSHKNNFVVTADDPRGPWSEPIFLEKLDGIDPSLFFDDDGKLYFIGTHPNPEGCKYNGDWYIYIQELDPETFECIGEHKNVWNGAMKGVHWPEGPHLYKIGEYYYIIHAEGGTGPEHAVSVARSKDVWGPYENNFKNPIFTHRHLGVKYPIQYVGHADLIQAANGAYYMCMLATRPVNGYTTMGRETFLARVIFENDWPVVNPGLGILSDKLTIDLPEFKPECDKRLTPLTDKLYDFTKEEKLDFNFLTLRNPKEDMYYLDNKGLNIKCSSEKVNYLCIRQDSHLFKATTVLNTEGLYNGAKAGFVLFQNSSYHVKIEYNACRVSIIEVKDGVETVLKSEMMPLDNITLYMEVVGLRAAFYAGDGNDVKDFCVKDIDLTSLSTEVAGGFVGCTIGMYATGAEGTDDTYAKFKNFAYVPLKLVRKEEAK